MNFYEMMCFAKVYSVVMGLSSPMTVSKQEIDVVFELLKRNTDNRPDWTHEQKETYKMMVDFVKHQIEG
ncbi:MAG: hypothetical protein IKH12_09805 [Clostridia bacterium]|nr:hypothetical protein [Clostridia bacterium]